MFSLFFAGLQQDLKLMLFASIVSAVFRLVFIKAYGKEQFSSENWRKWKECFRYGFWWGLDWHAYVFLVSMVLVSLPGAFLPTYYAISDTVRLLGGMLYALVLYTAFVGRMIFYHHFHDNFNETLWLGRKAEKHNFVDIFFHEDHGAFVLLSYVPVLAVVAVLISALLAIPQVSYPEVMTGPVQWTVNAVVFVLAVLLFYWLRFGGTLVHRDKPEWDEIPAIVKKMSSWRVRRSMTSWRSKWSGSIHSRACFRIRMKKMRRPSTASCQPPRRGNGRPCRRPPTLSCAMQRGHASRNRATSF